MLAGSLNSPYNYDPYYCLNNATKRRNTILKLMVKHGYITQSEYDEAVNTKIENTLVLHLQPIITHLLLMLIW